VDTLVNSAAKVLLSPKLARQIPSDLVSSSSSQTDLPVDSSSKHQLKGVNSQLKGEDSQPPAVSARRLLGVLVSIATCCLMLLVRHLQPK
jgi:hypothetical protein